MRCAGEVYKNYDRIRKDVIEMRRCVAGMLAVVMCATVFGGSAEASAAAKPKISKKKLTLTVGKSKTLKVTKAKGAKLTWKSSK